MKFWIDAQLSPALAPWITDTFAVEAFSIQRLGLRDATDERIFFSTLLLLQQGKSLVEIPDLTYASFP